jgi:hypothetical protein
VDYELAPIPAIKALREGRNSSLSAAKEIVDREAPVGPSDTVPVTAAVKVSV